jgi:hypothetical protein
MNRPFETNPVFDPVFEPVFKLISIFQPSFPGIDKPVGIYMPKTKPNRQKQVVRAKRLSKKPPRLWQKPHQQRQNKLPQLQKVRTNKYGPKKVYPKKSGGRRKTAKKKPIFKVVLEPNSPLDKLYSLSKINPQEILAKLPKLKRKKFKKVPRPRPVLNLKIAAPVRHKNFFQTYQEINQKPAVEIDDHPYAFEEADFYFPWEQQQRTVGR